MKKGKSENYLERKPQRASVAWTKDEKGMVTLHMENKGLLNRIMQKFFHKPKESHIHLDAIGSFLWPLMDGEKDLIELGRLLEKAFGDACAPLYVRLAEYVRILEGHSFIVWKK